MTCVIHVHYTLYVLCTGWNGSVWQNGQFCESGRGRRGLQRPVLWYVSVCIIIPVHVCSFYYTTCIIMCLSVIWHVHVQTSTHDTVLAIICYNSHIQISILGNYYELCSTLLVICLRWMVNQAFTCLYMYIQSLLLLVDFTHNTFFQSYIHYYYMYVIHVLCMYMFPFL